MTLPEPYYFAGSSASTPAEVGPDTLAAPEVPRATACSGGRLDGRSSAPARAAQRVAGRLFALMACLAAAAGDALAQAPPGYTLLPPRPRSVVRIGDADHAAQLPLAPTAPEPARGASLMRDTQHGATDLEPIEPRSASAAQPGATWHPVAPDGSSPGTAAASQTSDWCDEAVGSGWLRDRLWFRGEYLMWWNRNADLPPLATTNPVPTPRVDAGVLTTPSTAVLWGDDDVSNGMHSGGRFTIGAWSDPCEDLGVEATYLFLNRSSSRFEADGSTTPILARPFFNVAIDQPDAVLIAYPDQSTGHLTIHDATRLWSGEIVMRRALQREKQRDLDWLLGYRYARMEECLTLDQSITATNPVGAIPVGTLLTAFDHFGTRNDFHGAEIGAASRTDCGHWTINLAAKVALGDTRGRVDIRGDSMIAVPGNAPVASAGGVLAQPSNIGQYHRNLFTVLPEFDLRLDCHLTSNLSLTCGYTFLYWSRVARPQDQIDLNLNPTQFSGGQLTGPVAPLPRFASTDFWVQGVSFGADYRY